MRVRVRVFGVVQGVGFRDFVRRTAASAQLSGWVRNAEDGSVEALLDGAPSEIDHAVQMLRRGPPAASVERCEVSEEKSTDPIVGFEITY